jgi:hypothetical protein
VFALQCSSRAFPVVAEREPSCRKECCGDLSLAPRLSLALKFGVRLRTSDLAQEPKSQEASKVALCNVHMVCKFDYCMIELVKFGPYGCLEAASIEMPSLSGELAQAALPYCQMAFRHVHCDMSLPAQCLGTVCALCTGTCASTAICPVPSRPALEHVGCSSLCCKGVCSACVFAFSVLKQMIG